MTFEIRPSRPLAILFAVFFACAGGLPTPLSAQGAPGVPGSGRGAVNGASLVPTGSRVYDAVDYLSVLSGRANLLVRAPASENEILGALRGMDLPEGGPLSRLEESILRRLESGAPLLSVPAADKGAFLSVDPSFSLGLALPGGRKALLLPDLSDLHRGTESAVDLPLSISLADTWAAFANFNLRRGYWASIDSETWTTLPLSSSDVDMNMPSDAWVSSGSSWYTFSIGRGSLSAGSPLSGSMILSDSNDRYDWASLVLHGGRFRIEILPVELTPTRFLYFHGLAFIPHPSLGIHLSEAASVNSTLDLRYLNPAMVWHNYAGWKDKASYGTEVTPVGTQFGLSIDWIPLKGLKVYGQYAMNQFQTTYELENFAGAGYIPNSIGALGGLEYVTPWREGFLVLGAEGLYSNPWLYILENDLISWQWSRRELVAPKGHTTDWIRGWTGNPYGPDTLSAVLSARYDIPFSHRIDCSYRLVVQGDNGLGFLNHLDGETGTAYYPETLAETTKAAPSGYSRTQHSFLLSGIAVLSRSLEIGGNLGYYYVPGAQSASSVLAGITATVSLR